jgi:hypothetical protein
MRASWPVAISLCSFACASAPAATPSRTPASQASAGPAPRPAVAPAQLEPRALREDAHFADLVLTARLLLEAGRGDSDTGCLIAHDHDGYRLGADLMPAFNEIPDAPAELDAALQAAKGPIRVLTAWGEVGDGTYALALAGFTTIGPESAHALGLALLLTDQGVYLRYSDGAASADDGPLPMQAAVARLLGAPHNANAVLYVTAEAATPLGQLVELLRELPAGRQVALASPLPPGTRLPAAQQAAPAQTCPDGLPEPSADSTEGSLDTQAIIAALGPLRKDAQACLAAAQGQARAGGRLAVALRITQDGRVQAACVQRDAIGDATLEACVLASARNLLFPPPDPPGFVDVHLPLALTPVGPGTQRPLCE